MWKFSSAPSQLIVTNELLLVENDAEKQKVIRLIGFLCVLARPNVYTAQWCGGVETGVRVSVCFSFNGDLYTHDGSIYFLRRCIQ